MQTPSTKTLILIGIFIGFTASVALAVTFAPGDAVKTTDGVTLKAPNDRVAVTVYGTTNVSMDDAFPNSSTHGSQFADRSVIINSSDGNITMASDNAVSGSVHTSNLTGPWTNVTDITAGGNTLEIYPGNKDRVDVQGDVDNISISNMTVDDGNVDFVMGGTNGGTGTIDIYSLSATNTQIVAVDANGNYLDHGTSDANGNLTLDIGLSTQQVTLKSTGTTEAAVTSNPDPANNSQVASQPGSLEIDVNDSDFASGDDVEVNISLDGTLEKSTNITSNGTVTASVSNLDLGDHEWYVNTTDAYGNTNSTKYLFSLPQNLTIRNESNASQLIKDKNVTVKFYSQNGEVVVQRSDSNSDGNISLSGLPDTEFVVTFDGDGWYDRRAYIESIFNQQSVYLLNSTAYPTSSDDAIETTFVFEDRTNKFDQQDTTLRVQRAVDVNNNDSFRWTNVAGDYWGAAGEFPFTGQYQERYRLVIKNQETGDQRILGTHIPRDDGVKNLIVGDIIFDEGNATGLYFDAGINPNTTNLQAYYNDPTNTTTDLRIRIYEQGNKSNEIYNQTHPGPLGEKSVSLGITDDQVEKNWVVEFDGTNDDGNVYGQALVGQARYPINIDPAILTAVAYTMVTFVMALYGPRTAVLGAWAGVLMFMGLMFIGWLSWSIPAVTIAVVAASAGTFYKESLPS